MAGNKKPRRKHQQRWPPGTHAQNRALGAQRPLSIEQQEEISLASRAALEAMRLGYGAQEHFGTLAVAVNITIIFAEQAGPGAEAVARDARDAMWSVKLRADRLAKWGFGGGEAQAISAALDLHEQILGLVTEGEITRALAECQRRAAQGQHLGSEEQEVAHGLG